MDRLDLNDVTFVFPLPSLFTDRDQLLGMDSPGRGGALLPTSLQAELPAPLGDIAGTPDRAQVDEARVVAARVDPCFPGPAGTCRKQLRLVAQPIRDKDGAANTIDAAVHLFYDLDDTTFAALVDGLHQLKQRAGAKTTCKPLGVHPVMLEEGLTGAYAVELEALITSVAGAQTLSRVAVMQLGRVGAIWIFSAFDVVNGHLQVTNIARLGSSQSQMFTRPDVGLEPEVMDPAPTGSSLPLLLASGDVGTLTDAQIQPAIDEAFAVENPLLEDPTTADCVSCHVSDRVRRRADAIRGVTHTSTKSYARSAFALTLPDGVLGIASQRALGYFERDLSVNQRVVNESAEVAAALDPREN